MDVQRHSASHLVIPAKARNSALVPWSSRTSPDIAEVTVRALVARTPRSDMQACSASRITPTPLGASWEPSQSATCTVSRSWRCSRLAKCSTTRANLDNPTRRAPGR